MGFLFKFLAITLLIGVAGGFLINQVPSWKNKLIEVINPAAKEARLLGELQINLDEINNSINATADSKNPKDLEAQINKSRALLEKSKKLVGDISSTNENNSGIVGQQIGKIIDAILDRTPYPADHLTNSSPTPSPATCIPNK